MPYGRAGTQIDLYTFGTREDACAEWAARRSTALSPRDAARVLSGVSRRIAFLYIDGLLVVDVRHPTFLKHAGISLHDFAALEDQTRWRLADAARDIPGVGGLRAPPLTRGARDATIVFAKFVSRHVEVVHDPIQTVHPPLRSHSSPPGEPGSSRARAPIVELDRRRAEQRVSGPAADASQEAG